tara:strand:- start:871 stop:1236 length:366 start_codon:yes stop_codon:yes gene_type:complete
MKYITDFVCTYHLEEDLEDSNLLYRIQLMQAFIENISNSENTMDEAFNIIDKQIKILFNKYGSNKIINKIMDKYPNHKKEIQFQMCFSYSTFYIIHKILCGLINNNLDEDKYNKIIENINL